jgi:hypothetical protein
MAGVGGYTHNVGPEPTQIQLVEVKASVAVINTATVTVKVD